MTDALREPTASAGGSGSLPPTWLDVAGRAFFGDGSIGWRVELSEPNFLALRSTRERVVFIEFQTTDPGAWRRQLDRVARASLGKVHVAVLGGPREIRTEALAGSIELGPKLYLYHVDAAGDVWRLRRPAWSARRLAHRLEQILARSATRTTWSAAEASAYAQRIHRDQAASRSEASELRRFRHALTRRTPLATVSLVAIIGGVFALQALWGGVDLPPLLAHMGSLVPERALAGQWWRFFSCTFLHGGTLHLGLNLFVLWMLGRFLERFVGSAQFLLIYFASGLAGSVCSSLFVTSQSVGASGAIWGLLGAEAALAFYPRPLVPTALISFARRTAVANLALNLINSFNPHVDVAAHLGGGVMGALTFWLLAACGQLPARARAALPVRLGAIVLSCSFAAGLVVAAWAGQPWRLAELPEPVRVPMGASGWTVEVPGGLSAPSKPARGDTIELGNLAYDACVVDITWVDVPRHDGAPDSVDELSMIQRQLAVPPDGLEQVRPAEMIERASRRWVGARYRYISNPELVQDRAIGRMDGKLVRVDVTGWEVLPQSFDGVAAHILHSVAPLSPILSAYPRQRDSRVSLRAYSPPEVAFRGSRAAHFWLGQRRPTPFSVEVALHFQPLTNARGGAAPCRNVPGWGGVRATLPAQDC